jgi:hypothetical protein
LILGGSLYATSFFCNILVWDQEEWKEGVGSDKVLGLRVGVRVMIESSGGIGILWLSIVLSVREYKHRVSTILTKWFEFEVQSRPTTCQK